MKFRMMVAMMAVMGAAFVSYAGGPCCAAKAAKAEAAGDAVEASSVPSGDEAAPCKAMKSEDKKAACEAMKSEDKSAGCDKMKKMGCAPKLPEAAPAAEEAAVPAE